VYVYGALFEKLTEAERAALFRENFLRLTRSRPKMPPVPESTSL